MQRVHINYANGAITVGHVILGTPIEALTIQLQQRRLTNIANQLVVRITLDTIAITSVTPLSFLIFSSAVGTLRIAFARVNVRFN